MSNEATIPMAFARFGEQGVIPRWASKMKAERFAAEALTAETPSGVWVLQAANAEELNFHKAVVDRLSERIARSDHAVELVLHLATDPAPQSSRSYHDYLDAYRYFPALAGRMEVALGNEDLMPRVFEAIAKYIAASDRLRACMDPLSAAFEIQATRSALLSPKTGRLDASKIADALGMSVAKLADLLGKLRATVTKTPDAPALQGKLRSFERILRLKARLSDEAAGLARSSESALGRSISTLVDRGRSCRGRR